MRIALVLAAAALLSTQGIAQMNPGYGQNAPPPSATNGPYNAGGAYGDGRDGSRPKKTPEQKAQRKAAREAKLAAMSPAERQAYEQKRAARKAARHQQGPQG